MAHISRRSILSGIAAVSAVTVPTVAAAVTAPDPILALIAEERRLFDLWEDALTAQGDADLALYASEFHRQPRVLIGEYTRFVDDAFNRIPEELEVAEPIYLHTHDDIDRECDNHARIVARYRHDKHEDPEERRVRLHRALDADGEALKRAPVKVAQAEAEAASDRAGDLALEAFLAVLAATPVTVGGLNAALALAEERHSQCVHEDDAYDGVLALVRAFIGGRA